MSSINNNSRPGEGNPYNSITLLTLISSLWNLLVGGIVLKAEVFDSSGVFSVLSGQYSAKEGILVNW